MSGAAVACSSIRRRSIGWQHAISWRTLFHPDYSYFHTNKRILLIIIVNPRYGRVGSEMKIRYEFLGAGRDNTGS